MTRFARLALRLALMLCLITACVPAALAQEALGAAALHSRFLALHERLANNAFKQPLVLESTQNADNLRGDIYALIDQPYSTVAPALQSADQWCDILILHLNVKRCQVSAGPPQVLSLNIGRKYDQPIKDTYRVDFKYRAASKPDYLLTQLRADSGPFGTHDYRILFEAVPVDAKTFIHMSYSYGYGMAARIAIQVYLGTIGSDKVGFSVTGKQANGEPLYVGGVLGLVERNTMRYYLAIESYLDAARLPAAEQVERRLQDWHAGVERYARQLHELDLADYLAMKRKEIAAQNASQRSAPAS